MSNNLLLIEDEVNIGSSISEILNNSDLQTTWVENGEDAMTLIKQNNYDLVLCDVDLPGMNGYEILQQIRGNKNYNQTPFIFLTAMGNPQHIRKGMNDGADDYLVKPFSIKGLIETIKSRIEKSKKEAQLKNTQLNKDWLSVFQKNFNQEFLMPVKQIVDTIQEVENELNDVEKKELKEVFDSIVLSGNRLKRNSSLLMTYAFLKDNEKSMEVLIRRGTFNADKILTQCWDEFNIATINKTKPIQWYQENIGDLKGNPQFFKLVVSELIENMLRYATLEQEPEVMLKNTDTGFVFLLSNSCKKESLPFTIDDIQPFTKFHSDYTKSGLGIGLYLVKKIVLNLGLSLEITHFNNNLTIMLQNHRERNYKYE